MLLCNIGIHHWRYGHYTGLENSVINQSRVCKRCKCVQLHIQEVSYGRTVGRYFWSEIMIEDLETQFPTVKVANAELHNEQ